MYTSKSTTKLIKIYLTSIHHFRPKETTELRRVYRRIKCCVPVRFFATDLILATNFKIRLGLILRFHFLVQYCLNNVLFGGSAFACEPTSPCVRAMVHMRRIAAVSAFAAVVFMGCDEAITDLCGYKGTTAWYENKPKIRSVFDFPVFNMSIFYSCGIPYFRILSL